MPAYDNQFTFAEWSKDRTIPSRDTIYTRDFAIMYPRLTVVTRMTVYSPYSEEEIETKFAHLIRGLKNVPEFTTKRKAQVLQQWKVIGQFKDRQPSDVLSCQRYLDRVLTGLNYRKVH